MAKCVKKDIVDLIGIPDLFVVHQCNCVTSYACGLAKMIFEIAPYANTYSDPLKFRNIRQLGNISIHGNIVNFYAQYNPGKKDDKCVDREKAFRDCLNKLSSYINDYHACYKTTLRICFPYRIGCGLAGGNWKIYKGLIDNFAEKNPFAEVYIVERPFSE